MKIEHLKNRIKKNKLEISAGRYFVDETSEIISALRNEGKKALLGIQRKDGVYTILGEDFVYYSTVTGIKGKLTFNKFSNILQDYGLKKGKLFTNFRYLKIDDETKIWLRNKSIMSAIWNTVIWLEREKKLSEHK